VREEECSKLQVMVIHLGGVGCGGGGGEATISIQPLSKIRKSSLLLALLRPEFLKLCGLM
jgi:hypothetical protein